MIARAGSNRGIRSACAHERSATSSAAASFRSRPWAAMHRRVSWRGVPLPPTRAFAAWPDERSFPLSSPGGAHGVLDVLRRFAPAAGGLLHLWSNRAHMPLSVTSSARLIFVGLIVPLGIKENESKVPAANPEDASVGFWASSPVCGPYPRRLWMVCLGPRLPWTFGPLAGLRTRTSRALE